MDNKKYPDFILWFLNRPKTTGFIAFLFSSFIAGFIVVQQYQLVMEDEQQEMSNILKIVNQNLEQSLKNCYTTTLTLALTINDKGIPENFDDVFQSREQVKVKLPTTDVPASKNIITQPRKRNDLKRMPEDLTYVIQKPNLEYWYEDDDGDKNNS